MRRQQGFSEEEIGKNTVSRSEEEFHEKMILGKDKAGFGEMNPSIPTGFLNESEIQLNRDNQNLLSMTRYIEEVLGIKLTDIKKEILSKIMFTSQVSKARNGFGVKMAKTDIIRQDQSVYQSLNQEEEKGGIMNKLGGVFSRLSDKGNNVDVGSYGRNIDYGIRGSDKKKWR